MGNTPTGRADDLPTLMGIFKNEPKSRSEHILSSGCIWTQKVLKSFFASQSPAQQ
jgi:hypothetical protein